MALGAFEVSLLEMTSAYSVFPNHGIRVEPHFIRRVRDRNGKVLEESRPEVREVMKPETAFVTTWLLKGVTEEGTAAKAKALGRPLAGKTGTTDDYSDAWFIGSSPSLTCGVWIGTDRKETLGNGETGAAAALPVWISFFERALEGKPVEDFERPGGVSFVTVDRRTGKRATAESGCDPAFMILESFVNGTEPAAVCSPTEHWRLTLPYYLQRFEVNESKQLVATPEELAAVLQSGPQQVRLSEDGSALEAFDAAGASMSIPLALAEPADRARLKDLISTPAAPPAEDAPRGLDGRFATVREIHRD
jgi:penicillin-binding protein 1A